MRGRDGSAPLTEPPRAAAPRSSALLPGLAAAVSLAVVAGAALAGPWQMAQLAAPRFEPTGETATSGPTAPAETPPATDQYASLQPSTIAVILLVVVALLLVGYVAGLLLRHRSSGARRRRMPKTVAMDPPIAMEPDLPALRRGVAAARSVLGEHDDPDDAIIAAWLALEAAAASSGVDRAPSATPTEFTARVLDATRADSDAARTLLQLYQLARFGRIGRTTSADVAAAGRCLERLAESWEGR